VGDVILHLGLHKTGTTFLQKYIFPKLDGVFYANPIRPLGFRQCIITKKIVDNIPTLISYEGLSRHNYINDNEISMCEIASRLGKVFPDARAFVVLRNPDSWLRSLYNEYAKYDGRLPFDMWRTNIFDERDLDFEGYVSHLKSVFSDVLVLDYEYLRDDPHSFVNKLCRWIGTETPDFKIIGSNVSFNNRQLKFLRYCRYNNYIPNIISDGFRKLFRLLNSFEGR